jgi:hypothetical protein
LSYGPLPSGIESYHDFKSTQDLGDSAHQKVHTLSR